MYGRCHQQLTTVRPWASPSSPVYSRQKVVSRGGIFNAVIEPRCPLASASPPPPLRAGSASLAPTPGTRVHRLPNRSQGSYGWNLGPEPQVRTGPPGPPTCPHARPQLRPPSARCTEGCGAGLAAQPRTVLGLALYVRPRAAPPRRREFSISSQTVTLHRSRLSRGRAAEARRARTHTRPPPRLCALSVPRPRVARGGLLRVACGTTTR